MIRFVLKSYSSLDMVDKIENQLDKDKVEDYDISSVISRSDISISSDLKDTKIYIPEDLDYIQYQLDTWIRKNIFGLRPSVDYDRDVYIMSLGSPINFQQYIKLIKYIIDSEGFCRIYEV